MSTGFLSDPKTKLSVRVGWLVRFVLVLAVLVVAISEARDPLEPIFPVDDAYITAHNAEAVTLGYDPNFKEASPLHGATSLAHTFLVAALIPFLTPDWALFVVGFVGIAVYLLGALELANALKLNAAVGLLLAALCVAIGRTPHILTNGLETGWAMAGVMWAMAVEARPEDERKKWVPVLLGVLPFFRPELAAFSGLMLLLRVISRLQHGLKESLRAMGVDIGLIALSASPFLIAEVAATGSFFPATISAKKFFFAEGCMPAEHKLKAMRKVMEGTGHDLGYAVWLLPLLLTSRLGAVSVATLGVFLYAYYDAFPGALNHYERRYLYIFAPMLVFGLGTLAARRARVLKVAAILIALLIFYDAYQHWEERFWIHAGGRNFTKGELDKTARWVNANINPNDTVLVHDAGYISAKTKVKLVDLVGLKTPSSVFIHQDRTWFLCGGEGRFSAIEEITRLNRPKYLVVLDGWDRIYGFTFILRLRGYSLERVGPEGSYQIYRVTPPR